MVNANAILDDVNPQMPQARHDIQQLAGLGDTYANAAPDLLDFLNNAVITSRTINAQQKDLDQALLSAAGFGNTGADIFEQGRSVSGARRRQTWCPRAQLLDTYSPELFCTLRNYHDIEPKAVLIPGRQRLLAERPCRGAVRVGTGGRTRSRRCPPSSAVGGLAGAGRRRAEPVHLPGEPAAGERPRRAGGCAGLLAAHHPRPVARTRISDGHRQQPRAVQPLRHRIPYAIEYVWGRQVGDNTINP